MKRVKRGFFMYYQQKEVNRMATANPETYSTLDARDTFCPLPVIRAQRAIQDVPIGGILEILATDDGSVGDIPAWARNVGQEFLTYSQDQSVHRFLVKRLQ